MSGSDWIEEATGARVVGQPEVVQELWSGYGVIERWRLAGGPDGSPTSVVLKRVEGPRGRSDHPRGWASRFADARKRRSYRVERRFYREHGEALGAAARLPRWLAEHETELGGSMLLEDLDAAGFPVRLQQAKENDVRACVAWLAAFHAASLGRPTDGLWERGTYWHLATRPDELEAMEDQELRAAAAAIDARLESARHRSFVHGDAKLANFCFSQDRADPRVAAVDLQYVGGGVGVQDLAYFLGSCLDDRDLEQLADGWLERYFDELARGLDARGVDAGPVVREWRALWPYAWADFHRFLVGWAPDHWKLSPYSERVTRAALRGLGSAGS